MGKFCEQNYFLNVEIGGTYYYHCALIASFINGTVFPYF
jgi:hypothetical protein